MNRTTAKAAAIAAVLMLSPAVAFADGVLYDAYRTQGGAGGVAPITPQLVDKDPAIPMAKQPTGVAAAGGSLFVGYDTTLSVYDQAGALQASYNTGPGFKPGLMAASADTLFVGYTTLGGATGVDFLGADSALTEKGIFFNVPGALTGLAYGDDTLFVSYSHHLAKYDMTGALIQDVYMGPFFDPGPLAFGDDTLYVAYTMSQTGATGVDFISPAFTDKGTFFNTASLATGLAYGDGQLFASFEHDLATYDGKTGAQTNAIYTGANFYNGPLAFAEAGAGLGVPEPATWAVMILGFGMIGANLRRRSAIKAWADR